MYNLCTGVTRTMRPVSKYIGEYYDSTDCELHYSGFRYIEPLQVPLIYTRYMDAAAATLHRWLIDIDSET